jgi:MarR family transcriptional regulator for hemolysin
MARKTDVEVAAFTRQAVMLILHIMRNLRTAGMEVDLDVELSYPQVLVLYALLEKGTCTMSELSKWLKISHGVATRTVDRLVEKGMVERRHGSEDRRVVLVSLSPGGEDYAEKMITCHLEEMNKVFSGVPAREREGFIGLLAEIDKQLEK